eukprot:NODE_492_length_6837_cov_0.395963.p4 type:complete len:204 gc:universal NODE_492_length_6837_cov_0.395963:1837-2448(+)
MSVRVYKPFDAPYRMLLRVVFLITCIFAQVSTDCAAVVSMAQQAHFDIAQPDEYVKLSNNCCTSRTIECDAVPLRVMMINWKGLGLSGSISNAVLPDLLEIFDISNNKLTGNLPALPANMIFFWASNNLLTGSISYIPPRMYYFYVDSNQFTGSISFQKPIKLDIHNNQFSSLFINNTRILVSCGISTNSISQVNANLYPICQ